MLRLPTLEQFRCSLDRPYENALPDPTCPICHEEFTQPVQTACSHIFDRQCLLTWFESTHRPNQCPSCRTPLIQGRQNQPAIVTTETLLIPDWSRETFNIPTPPPLEVPRHEFPVDDSMMSILSMDESAMARIDREIVAWMLLNAGNMAIANIAMCGEELVEFRKAIEAMYRHLDRRHGDLICMKDLPLCIMTGTADQLVVIGEENLAAQIVPDDIASFEGHPRESFIRLSFLLTWLLWDKFGRIENLAIGSSIEGVM